MIHPSTVDPVDYDARADAIADALADAAEAAYDEAERAGVRLDSILCADCPDPGLCAAEGECPR